MEKKYLILIYSGMVAVVIALVGLFLFDFELVTMLYLIVICIATLLLPFSFYESSVNNKIKNMENFFPIFLKDLSDSLRSGLNIVEGFKNASKTDYGDFNDEITRMSNKMSWGVSFEQVLNESIEKLNRSDVIKRGFSILRQAYLSGGNIGPILTNVADSTVLLQNVERDQQSNMVQQTAIIYIIQLVFIVIVIILFKVLIPISSQGGFGEELFGLQGSSADVDMDYYKGFFFTTLVIQSVCNGLVAGVTSSGKVVNGVKHVAFMVCASLILFTIFILPKVLQLNVSSERYSLTTGQAFNVMGAVSYDDTRLVNQKIDVLVINTTYSGFTDELGEYSINVKAPIARGDYDGIVRVSYDNKIAEAMFSFNVR